MIKRLQQVSRLIDQVTEKLGKLLGWLILATVFLSAGNAMSRYTLSLSSNAMLELQWYLFSAVFLLGGGYALKYGAHVRIDVLSSRLSPRAQACIDVFGTLCFLMPTAALMLYFSWPVFLRALSSSEVSTNAGGLLLWPARLLVPLGFALLLLQSISELLKRINDIVSRRPALPGTESTAHPPKTSP